MSYWSTSVATFSAIWGAWGRSKRMTKRGRKGLPTSGVWSGREDLNSQLAVHDRSPMFSLRSLFDSFFRCWLSLYSTVHWCCYTIATDLVPVAHTGNSEDGCSCSLESSTCSMPDLQRCPERLRRVINSRKAQRQAHDDRGLEEQCRLWEQSHDVRVSTSTMSRAIQRFGWTRKKPSGQ